MGWWIWATKNISICVTVSMNLPAVSATSTALNHSGHMQNEGLQSSMVFHGEPFLFISRNVNSGLIIEQETEL